MTAPEGLAKLREEFAATEIGKLPKPTTKDGTKGRCAECNGYHQLPAVHLDYVGHAAVTKRLLDVDAEWTWEPVAFGPDGLPALDRNGGLWIRLTVLGTTRLGYGDAQGKQGGNAVKEAIGDALRNAAMRFGVALELWHKGDFADVPEETPQVDWLTEAKDAPTADAAAHVWKMARANKADQEVLDAISTIGTEKREAERQAQAGEPA
jgi:hypothetical protein